MRLPQQQQQQQPQQHEMINSKQIKDGGVVVVGGIENQKPWNYNNHNNNNNNNTRRRSEGENNNHNNNKNNSSNNNKKRLRNDDQGGTNTKQQHQQQQQQHHQQQQHQQQQPQQRLVPPDGGWGWMVALGTFLVTMLLPTMSPCFGVLFSQYLISENTSSTVTAWIFNTQAFIWNSSGILGRPLSRELGWRRVGVTGAFFAALGLGCCALMPSPLYLFLTFSCMAGVGGGLVTSLCFTILPQYFDRKRGIATAVMMGGICFGQIVGPPVARLLQEEYGYKGATLILGAILLHSCIGASFFHPPEWYLKPSTKEEEEVEEKEDYNDTKKQGEKLLINKELTRGTHGSNRLRFNKDRERPW
ncbi:hypothetical protein Pmani_017696 [Petrolisthes manimaculis]|uniref:Major facilitator superfamily (MFS) profile domain-containing protein n=1 Tax=Petrolisthes manimaculis TaxID=1843537 RepID=A0AAE1U5J3_9EUCA|nr:hypothetical protein Pmani_017696 [Petrolisthes manimaculis]